MNRILTFPNDQRLREQAGNWIARLDRGLRQTERLELQKWLSESVRHRDAFFEMAGHWDRMDVLSELSALFPLESSASKWMSSHARPIAWSLLVVLAAVALGFWVNANGPTLAAFTARNTFWPRHNIEATYRAAVGEQRVVTLPDKSIITLNTDTLLRVHYTDSERKIELIRGEAAFEVAKHEGRLFTVQVGQNEFRAVGTAFNIRVQSEREIKLTVTEGRVQVVVPTAGESSRQVTVNAATSRPLSTEIMVDAGKEVAIDNATQTVEHLQPAELKAILAWKQGVMEFDGEPLERAIQEVSRYSNDHFIIGDEATRQIPVSGYFKVGDIDGLIAALHSNFDINVSRNGDTITLSSH